MCNIANYPISKESYREIKWIDRQLWHQVKSDRKHDVHVWYNYNFSQLAHISGGPDNGKIDWAHSNMVVKMMERNKDILNALDLKIDDRNLKRLHILNRDEDSAVGLGYSLTELENDIYTLVKSGPQYIGRKIVFNHHVAKQIFNLHCELSNAHAVSLK